jgi:hypothetical protein
VKGNVLIGRKCCARLRRELRGKRRGTNVDEALLLALKTVAGLEIPHLDLEDEDAEIVH